MTTVTTGPTQPAADDDTPAPDTPERGTGTGFRRRTKAREELGVAIRARATGKVLRPYAGWAFIGAGSLLVVLGYVGVSGEAIVAKQLPYLASGGVGGILLCVIGAYFLGTEELRADSGRLDRLERQVAELHVALLSRPDAPSAGDGPDPEGGTGGPDGPETGADEVILEVPATGTAHRSTCALAEGREAVEIEADAARARDLRTCPVCEPRLS